MADLVRGGTIRKQLKGCKMPESHSRKKQKYTPQVTKGQKRQTVRIGSPRWVAPLMVTCFLLGLLWIVAWYIAPTAPFIGGLSYWNVVIGFALILVGFAVSTRWK